MVSSPSTERRSESRWGSKASDRRDLTADRGASESAVSQRMSSDDSSEDEDEKQRRLKIAGILVTSEQVKTEEASRAIEAAKPRDATSEAEGSEFEKHQTRQLHAMLERTFATRLQPGVWEASATWAPAPESMLCLFKSSTVRGSPLTQEAP